MPSEAWGGSRQESGTATAQEERLFDASQSVAFLARSGLIALVFNLGDDPERFCNYNFEHALVKRIPRISENPPIFFELRTPHSAKPSFLPPAIVLANLKDA